MHGYASHLVTPHLDDRLAGYLLVGAQFALLAWLVWPLTPQAWSPLALAFAGGAVAVGFWTLAWNRPGNFNIHPEPRARGRLVTGGPYAHMRHPMYTAVLLFAMAEAVAYVDEWKLLATALLALVLLGKSRLEEKHLRRRYPEYAAYATRVRRFIPGVF